VQPDEAGAACSSLAPTRRRREDAEVQPGDKAGASCSRPDADAYGDSDDLDLPVPHLVAIVFLVRAQACTTPAMPSPSCPQEWKPGNE